MRHLLPLASILQVLLTVSAFAQTPVVPRFAPAIVGAMWTRSSSPFVNQAYPVDLDKDGIAELVVVYGSMPNSGLVLAIDIVGMDPKTRAYRVTTGKYLTGTVPSLISPRTLSAGDFNGDGIKDLFIGGHGNDDRPWPGEKDWLLLSQVGGKHRAVTAPPGVDGFTHSSAAADVDRDGSADIYVGTICCGTQKPYMLFGKKGGLPIPRNGVVDVAALEAAYTAAALADINGDGRPDLVLGRFELDPDRKSIVYYNRNGSFAAATPDIRLPDGFFGPTTTVLDILPVDVDSDGRPDLVLSETGSDYVGYAIQILHNEGTGRFADWNNGHLSNGGGNSLTGGFVKTRIQVADFYGDGIPDLVAQGAFLGDADAIVWLNDGTGNFTPFRRSLFADTSKEPVGPDDLNIIAPIDVNRDGRTDLVRVGNYNADDHAALTYINRGVSRKPAVPVVVRQPKPVAVAAGKGFTLSVAATGRPLSFQWFRNGVAVPGATAPVLRVARAMAGNVGRYSVRVSNPTGRVTSRAVAVRLD